jgi:HD-GYP domain-containing protein (c-di-GMP phosphodiesterase class II)
MQALVREFAAAVRRPPAYVAVESRLLETLEHAPVDIYTRIGAQSPIVLWCGAGLPITAKRLFSLSDAGVANVFVSQNDHAMLGEALYESVRTYIKRKEVPVAQRFRALQNAASIQIERTMQLVDSRDFVVLSSEMGAQLTDLLSGTEVVARDLYVVARHDFNTFTHITNVACYCVVLAMQLGVRDIAELKRLATGAMVHDLGKRFIPQSVLTKAGRLDRLERDLIEAHPQRGYEQLYDQQGLDVAQLMMVYQHHERVDGSGYPVRILGDEIHPWAKWLAVVDVFEAMTGKRPYRRPASRAETIAYLRELAGSHFDRESVSCWTSTMQCN